MNRSEWLLLLLALVIFLTMAFYQIELPALNYDEAFDAVPAMEMLQGAPVDAISKISVAGHEFPLMIMSYKGAVATYLVLPFFWLWGVGVGPLRTMTILISAFTLVLIYLWAREFFDRRVAAITLLLMAVNPAFIFWSRIGVYVSSPVLLMSVGSLLSLWRWQRGGREGYLYAGGFLLGLGLSTKIAFLWFLVAMIIAGVILDVPLRRTLALRVRRLPEEILRLEVEAGTRRLAFFLFAFALGAGPFLIYNLTTLGTLQTILANLFSTQLYGVSNLDFLNSLLFELKSFSQMLDGSYFGEEYKGTFSNPLYSLLFLLATLYFAWEWIRKYLPQSVSLSLKSLSSPSLGEGDQAYLSAETGNEDRRNSRGDGGKIALLFILLGTMLVESCFTVSSLGAIHLLILLPFPQMILAVFLSRLMIGPLWEGWGRGWQKRLVPAFAVAAFALLIAFDLGVVAELHRALARTGGEGGNSEALYRLADYLKQEGITSPVTLDWGFRKNIQLLT